MVLQVMLLQLHGLLRGVKQQQQQMQGCLRWCARCTGCFVVGGRWCAWKQTAASAWWTVQVGLG